MLHNISRRYFFFGTVLAGAVPASGFGTVASLKRLGFKSPNEKLNIAAIGAGGKGSSDINACAATENIVAMADPDEKRAERTFAKYPQVPKYKDFRQMFDKEEKNIDAVIVATPDHNHAIVTMRALRAGKHVYCAKPMTHTIYEARTVVAAAREAKAATQMSVQSCASDAALSTAEILSCGAIGPVHEVHVWTDHPIYPAAGTRPTDAPAVPYGLDWELWIGTAPYRPYHPAYHPWIWRSWWDFGSGTVGDMACHAMHVFYRALDLTTPTRVCASRTTMHGGYFVMHPDGKETLPPRIQTPETESYSCMISWEFPARGSHPPLVMYWYDGGLRPHRPIELDSAIRLPNSGLLFVGEKGKLMADYSGGRNRLLPEARFRDFQPPPKTLARSIGHYKEWVAACKGGKPANCNFEFGGRMTEIAQLGTIAARAARLLEWDPERMLIVNDPEANSWVNPPYRAGWSLTS